MLRSFILFAGLVLALGLAGCPQQAEEPAGDAEVTEEVVVEEVPAEAPADDSGSMEEAPADDSGSMEEAPADSGDGSSSEDTSGEDSM